MSSSDRILGHRVRGPGLGIDMSAGDGQPPPGTVAASGGQGRLIRGTRPRPPAPQGAGPMADGARGEVAGERTLMAGTDAVTARPAVSAPLGVDLRELQRRAQERGYAMGLARARAELGAAIEAAGSLAAQLEAMAPTAPSSVALAVASLSTAIARRILGAELSHDSTVLVRSLEAALTTINGSPEARVLLHPDQLGPVQTAWETAHGTAYLGKRWTFEADASLPAGGCVLRYEHGVVDAGLDAQVAEIAAALDEVIAGPRWAAETGAAAGPAPADAR